MNRKMKARKWKGVALVMAAVLLFTGCGSIEGKDEGNQVEELHGTVIRLSDEEITVDQNPISTDKSNGVYAAHDIVYYESGKEFTYGEGTGQDAHSREEADEHTVVHITEAGTYILSGTLSRGQITVDLGEDAKDDPEAVVTLVLNGVDITCQVAPAIIFYRVYECGEDEADTASKDVDTAGAGANVIIVDGTANTVHGSYVARIYEPDSVVLNEEKTQVEDAKKLHKYDGAFYSRMSMNVSGGPENTGKLTIYAENEGLDSELHLTINGGNLVIYSGNDGINTNEDGISVTTINGGTLQILVTGETGEGDGIDSNGWLVINGGTVIASACGHSMDAGVDSDMGIHVNGGTLMASGYMLDRIEDGGQTYVVFNFSKEQKGSDPVVLKDEAGISLMEYTSENSYSVLVFSSPELEEGTYTLWCGETQLAGQSNSMMGGMPGGMMPGGEMPEGGMPGGEMPGGEMPGGEMPEGGMPGGEMPKGEMPAGEPPAGNQEPPESWENPNAPGNGGGNQGRPGRDGAGQQETVTEFKILSGVNLFSGVCAVE